MWFGNFLPETITYLHEGNYQRALKDAERTGAYVSRKDFEEVATLELEGGEELDADVLRDAIEAREVELRPRHPSILGMQRVLQQSPFDRPKWSKRSAMPLCLFSCREAKKAFMDGWFAFLEEYREASKAFRAGQLDVLFPMFSFRPSIPSG